MTMKPVFRLLCWRMPTIFRYPGKRRDTISANIYITLHIEADIDGIIKLSFFRKGDSIFKEEICGTKSFNVIIIKCTVDFCTVHFLAAVVSKMDSLYSNKFSLHIVFLSASADIRICFLFQLAI